MNKEEMKQYFAKLSGLRDTINGALNMYERVEISMY